MKSTKKKILVVTGFTLLLAILLIQSLSERPKQFASYSYDYSLDRSDLSTAKEYGFYFKTSRRRISYRISGSNELVLKAKDLWHKIVPPEGDTLEELIYSDGSSHFVVKFEKPKNQKMKISIISDASATTVAQHWKSVFVIENPSAPMEEQIRTVDLSKGYVK